MANNTNDQNKARQGSGDSATGTQPDRAKPTTTPSDPRNPTPTMTGGPRGRNPDDAGKQDDTDLQNEDANLLDDTDMPNTNKGQGIDDAVGKGVSGGQSTTRKGVDSTKDQSGTQAQAGQSQSGQTQTGAGRNAQGATGASSTRENRTDTNAGQQARNK